MNKKGNTKLWITVIGVIVGAISAYFGYRNYRNQLGGSMNATFQTRLINNGETKTIVVCLEDSTIILNELPITPTFENPNGYSLKDFSLSLEAECSNVLLMPSSFFDEHERGKNKRLYSYTKGVLAAFNETQAPFSCIQLNGSNGRCFIKSKASYNGIHSAFEYYTDVLFFVVPNSEDLPYIAWKKKCEESINGTIKDGPFDIYYCAKGRKPEYNFDIVNNLSDQHPAPLSFDSMDLGMESDHYELLDPAVIEVRNNLGDGLNKFHEVADCKILRAGNALRYFLTLKPCDDCETGLYILEGRHRLDSINPKCEKYEYLLLNIEKSQKTIEHCVHYGPMSTPIIDQVSLYPQCDNKNVISIKQKNNRYVVENLTGFTIVCFIHYSDNSYTHFVLDAHGKKSLNDIGVLPIEVFNTNRKTTLERNDSRASLGRFLLILLLSLISYIGGLFLLINIGPFIKSLFSKKKLLDIREAFGKTMFSNLYQGYHNCKSKSIYIVEMIVMVMALLSPLAFYFLFFKVIVSNG